MKREFVYFERFDKKWIKMGLTDSDLDDLEDMVLNNPDIGDIIQGTGGLRKMRFTLPNRGKRGGARILYIDFISYEITAFFDIYPKDEQETITDKQKKEYKKEIEIFIKGYRKD